MFIPGRRKGFRGGFTLLESLVMLAALLVVAWLLAGVLKLPAAKATEPGSSPSLEAKSDPGADGS